MLKLNAAKATKAVPALDSSYASNGSPDKKSFADLNTSINSIQSARIPGVHGRTGSLI